MAFRWLRRRRVFLSYYIRPMPRAKKAALIALFSLAVILVFSAIILNQLRPIILQLAKSEVNATVLRTVNKVVEREISQGALEYSKIITLQKDINGNITALETNMATVNRLQTQISQGVVDELENSIISELRIPIGSAIGGELFPAGGRRLPSKSCRSPTSKRSWRTRSSTPASTRRATRFSSTSRWTWRSSSPAIAT